MPFISITDMERKIAAKLQTRRKLLGISEESMAFANSISIEEYRGMESAKKRINPTLLYEFACLLNAPLEYFFWFEEKRLRLYQHPEKANNSLYLEATEDGGISISKPFNIGSDDTGEWILKFNHEQLAALREFLARNFSNTTITDNAASDCIQMLVAVYGNRKENPFSELKKMLEDNSLSHEFQRW